jgi:hypothetical protein
LSRSLLDLNSITKSGTTDGKATLVEKLSSFDREIQVTSGDLIAPFGSVKPPEESNTSPNFVRSFYSQTLTNKLPFCLELSHPAGAIVTSSPVAVNSNLISGLFWHNCSNCAGVMNPDDDKLSLD